MKRTLSMILILAFTTSLAYAADDPATTRDKTKRGAIIGAVAGGVLGAVVGNNNGKGNATRGAVIGTVAGTAIGVGIGAYMDRQERALRQIDGVNVRRTADDELAVTVKNEVLFNFGSAGLRPASKDSLREMANVFDKYGSTTIRVEGFTDSIGSASSNERLSERRSASVSNYLERLGVEGSRLDAIGYGESQPRSTNSTARGRQLNRRVEIHVKADRSA
jgi:outer membrane protein OmpA-like peptidoglycan-associated protein